MSGFATMSETLNLNVRLKGTLRDHVIRELDTGIYDNVSEYVRALIRRDYEKADQVAFEKLKAQLQADFSVSDGDCVSLTAEDIFARNAHLSN